MSLSIEQLEKCIVCKFVKTEEIIRLPGGEKKLSFFCYKWHSLNENKCNNFELEESKLKKIEENTNNEKI